MRRPVRHGQWPSAASSDFRRWTSDKGQANTTERRKLVLTEGRNRDIYVMDIDGGNRIRLTGNLAVDMHPAWSPDGDKIAFLPNRDGNFEIYVMEAE